jgi:hypothetical protein
MTKAPVAGAAGAFLWKANDPFGRLAFVGMIVFCISALAKAVRRFT